MGNGHAQGGAAALRTTYAVLAALGLEGDALTHAARAVRAALHSFVALEANDAFGLPQDIDRSFTLMVETLESGLRAQGGISSHEV